MFFAAGVGASALIALYAVFGMLFRKLYINGATGMKGVEITGSKTVSPSPTRNGASWLCRQMG